MQQLRGRMRPTCPSDALSPFNTTPQSLASELQELEAASHQWEHNAASAGASHRELMARLEQTAADLNAATAQLRAAEAGRLEALREAEAAGARAEGAEAEFQALRATLEQRWGRGAGAAGRRRPMQCSMYHRCVCC